MHEQPTKNEQEPMFEVGITPDKFEELLEKGEVTSESDLLPQNIPTRVGDFVLVKSLIGGGPKNKVSYHVRVINR